MKSHSVNSWKLAYAGEDEQAAADKAAADKAAADKAAAGSEDDKPVISNKKLNAILADERKKTEARTKDLTAQLEQLKQSSGLTEKEKRDLEARIEDLNNSLLSKAELAEKEKKKLEGDYKKQLEGSNSERDTWKSRYTTAIISRSITDAAVAAEAYAPSQIVAMIQQSARLAEVVDADGKPTGEFVTKVKFNDVDKDGKPVVLDLTVDETVKRMKEIPEIYGNLFKSTLAGGIGGNGNGRPANRTTKPPQELSDEDYKKWRKEQGLTRTQ